MGILTEIMWVELLIQTAIIMVFVAAVSDYDVDFCQKRDIY